MNKCGNCTLCCKVLGVVELEKPANKWCNHCTPGKGCNIYSDRPKSCVDFECGWLLSDLPIEFRPDYLHIIITGEASKINAAVWHCDPKYPDAYKSTNAEKLIQFMAANDKSIILVTGNKRKIISTSDKDTQRIQQILHTMDKEGE